MQVVRAYKYALYHQKQNKLLHQRIDIAGIIKNHVIALQKRYFRRYGGYIKRGRMEKHIAKMRNTTLYAYWQLVGSQAVQEIIERVDTAYQRFFKKIAQSPPRFKKVKTHQSFVLKQQAGWQLMPFDPQKPKRGVVIIQQKRHKFVLDRPLPEDGQIKRVQIKRDALGKLWVIFYVKVNIEQHKVATGKAEGFDFGLKTFLTLSDGTQYHMPEHFRDNMGQLRQLQRKLSRAKKGSKNRVKLRKKVARHHRYVADKRRDTQHKMTTKLVQHYDELYFEDLNMDAMKRLWGRKVSDYAFAQFLTILKYKAKEYRVSLEQIDRFYPSTKTCSKCGVVKKEMPLKERTFECEACGMVLDRDHNAAINIYRRGATVRARGNCQSTETRSSSAGKLSS